MESKTIRIDVRIEPSLWELFMSAILYTLIERCYVWY